MSKSPRVSCAPVARKTPRRAGEKIWVPSKRNSLHLGTVKLVGTEFKQTP